MTDLITRREKLLGPGMRQFYEFPFQPVRAEGVWVQDAAGRKYLDAYNNVPHVGHCHPHVVARTLEQLRTLNTNTRYLDETILAYAEKLLATMPPELDVCMFTCSGTEANELAWRLARAFTGAGGAIATRNAYHGNSTIIDALDVASAPPGVVNDWVATVQPPPHALGGLPATAAADYADAFLQTIATLAARGHRPAAFYFDPLFATDGLARPPAGFLAPALATLHEAGGLAVADEVQPGFGRTGRHMWGFQDIGIKPDIVTMGKATGNGHPIGVVVTRREIVEAFRRQGRYFNTFGGNQVSCAAGMAVLEVLERENLLANAENVGAYLHAGLNTLRPRHELVADIRGTGLFIGVELAVNGRPATAEARRVINELCRQGVLVGLTGPGLSVLKIRPPMVFTRDNADMVVQALDTVLASPR